MRRYSGTPDPLAVVDTQALAVQRLLRYVALVGVALLAIAGLLDVTRPAAAAPARRSGGVGVSTVSVIDFSEAAKSPDARTPPPPNPREEEFHRRTRPRLPSRRTSGARKVPPAAAIPFIAPAVSSTFDGLTESCSGCGVPPDPNAATSGAEIVEVVNSFIQVTDTSGTVLCGGGVTLNRLLRTTDSLTDPRVQFDNRHQRFSLAVTVTPATNSATPAMWVAASDSADACGTWRVYRLTFSGDPFPAGTFLDFPMLGQDTNALLISTRNLTPHDGRNFTVYGLPKTTIYAGNPVSFNTFNVDSLTAPVTNAGQPMISSPVSFFLAAVPGTGYRLFRLTNSGGSGATLTKTTINSFFKAPTREANQPGTTSTIDSSDGNILASPYFDGTSIWFAHDFDLVGFPTVRYGAVNVSTNKVATAAAFHSATSDDFNPSLAVGLNPSGTSVFVNWAFTDAKAGTATSDVIDMLPAGQSIANLIGTGAVYAAGSNTTQTRFGDFSSVSLDPQVSGGTCAVATQQYFSTNGSWKTRLARVGNCQLQPPVLVPDVRNDRLAQAGQVLVAAGLIVGQVTNVRDPTCNNIGTVLRQNPDPGTPVQPGSAVRLSIGQRPPPPFQCP
jgi:PASTA domain-containing protein